MAKGNRQRDDDEFEALIAQVAEDPEFSRLGAGRIGSVGAPAAGPRDYVVAEPADDVLPTAPPVLAGGTDARVVAGWLALIGGIALAVTALFVPANARIYVGGPGVVAAIVGFVLLLTRVRRASASDAGDGAVL